MLNIPFSAQQMHVLYCEADMSLSGATLEILEEFFGRVDHAYSEESIVEHLEHKEKLYDLVITEVEFPHFDGMNFLQHLKNTRRDLTVLVISGREDKESLIRMIQIGIHDFLPKPYDSEELVEKLSEAVQEVFRKKEFQKDLDALIEYKEAAEMVLDKFVNHLSA